MNSFSMSWPATFDTTDPGGAVLASLYDVTAMDGVETYSDLDYEQYNVVIGGSYSITPALYMTVEGEYAEFVDNEEYVYGDQSGEYYRGNLGVGYRF